MKRLFSSIFTAVLVILAFGAVRNFISSGSSSNNQQVSEYAVGLSGAARDGFVNAAIPACLKSQTADPENKNVPPRIIQNYCNCYATNLAAALSINDIKKLGPNATAKEMQTALSAQITAAGKPCLEQVGKEFENK